MQLLSYIYEAECTSFQTHYFSKNLVAPGIEPGISGSVARNSDHYNTEEVNEPCSAIKCSEIPE
jgi:hypothetical protein